MILNSTNIAILNRAFNAAFMRGFAGVSPLWDRVATLVPSTTTTEDYGWLGQVPGMREWIGDRQIKNLSQSKYSITNKEYENTVGVPRPKIEDDTYGVYSPVMEMMGNGAAEHPDQLIFALLSAGFATECYDGQYMFDTDHPVIAANGATQSVSNYQAGASNPWFLMDTRRPLKPLILQMRKKPNFVTLNKPEDPNVFLKNQIIYGVDDRKSVGFGFWQMAYGSKAALSADNFETVLNAMGAFKGDHGRPLGIRPDLLVVGNSNQSAGRKIVEAQYLAGGASNTNFNVVKLLVVPWLD